MNEHLGFGYYIHLRKTILAMGYIDFSIYVGFAVGEFYWILLLGVRKSLSSQISMLGQYL